VLAVFKFFRLSNFVNCVSDFFIFWQLLDVLVDKQYLKKIIVIIIFILSVVVFFAGLNLFANGVDNALSSPIICRLSHGNKSWCDCSLATGDNKKYPSDEKYCHMVSREHIRNYCFERVGFLKNQNLCHFIENTDSRDYCLEEIDYRLKRKESQKI